ncbi:MAG: aspartate kinase [Bacteroidaceae bacterium]|nr:aspartate kinase [Bacteroidaceae bacterium]
MKIMKFGGTSVGSPERMKDVVRLVTESGEQRFVVLSAMSGTTNNLVEIADYISKNNIESALNVLTHLRHKYAKHLQTLYATDKVRKVVADYLAERFDWLRSCCAQPMTPVLEREILAQGELMSTHMVIGYMEEQGIDAVLVPAFDFMRTGQHAEPDQRHIRTALSAILEKEGQHQVYLTQGFICINKDGEIDNLQRGGSDYTACLIGAVLKAEEIQIWTDIDGMHNNDPRFVENTKPVRHISFEEAAELAYFGAKILHPTCIQPARYANVPVRLLNTLDPQAPGTLINNATEEIGVKAIAAKDNITAIKVISSRMLLASGFLARIFQVFDEHDTSIDMVTTSEVGVSLTIDDTTHLEPILDDLRKLGFVQVDTDQCIICVVGDMTAEQHGYCAQVLNALKEKPVRMICYGGSDHNVSVLVSMEQKQWALQQLSKHLFG